MRIKHKYLRNKHFRAKHWKRIRSKAHPFKTSFPYRSYTGYYYSAGAQIKEHFDWIGKEARQIENGSHMPSFGSAPKHFRKEINAHQKQAVRSAMHKIQQGDYEAEVPVFKRNAAWAYW